MASLPRPEAPNPLKPSPRISDPERLRAVWRDLYEADRFAGEDRATLTDEFSGGLPFQPEELENAGMGQMGNINWGIGEQQIRAHISTYCSLTRSGQYIAKVYLKPDLKISYDKRVQFQGILAEEFHKLNTKTPAWRAKYKARIEVLAREYCLFGVCFAFFEDLKDWRFNCAGLNKVKMQRGATYDGPDATEVAFMRREYTAAEFVEPLRNGEKAATRAGWNVEALKAGTQRIMERYGFRQDLETFVHEIKNNDLYYRSGRAETIPVLHSFVQEFNGKYSWYIMPEESINGSFTTSDSGEQVEPWLFKKEFVFDDATDCLIPFLMEIGTGELHSVRGTGHRLFEIDVQRNRTTCLMLDNCIQSGTNMFQAGSENAMEDFDIFRIGAAQIVPPGFTFLEKNLVNQSPNLEAAMKMLGDVQDQAAGVFTTRQPGNGGGTSQDASETRSITDQNIAINENDRVNWMEPLGMVYNAQWRRIVKSKATDKGGMLAQAMIKNCVSRGVPIDIVLNGVDFLEPMLGVFLPGTTTSMDDQLERITKISGALPAQGRDEILRASAGEIVGWDNIDSIIPPAGTGGPNIQGQLAIVENPTLTSGLALPVSRNQDHLAHAVQHAVVMDPTAQNAMQAIQSGNVQGTGPAMQGYGVLLQHYGAHVAQLTAMPTPPPETTKLKDILTTNQRTFKQLTRVANANAQRAQKQIAQAQAKNGTAAPGGGPTPDEQATLVRAQTERQIALQTAQVRDNILKTRAQTQDQNSQIRTAQKIQSGDLVTQQKLQKMQQEQAGTQNSPDSI